MVKIKDSEIKDIFYPAKENDMIEFLKHFKKYNTNPCKCSTRAIIAPHAGWIYSGMLAYEAFSQLDRNIENVFIFSPAHKLAFEGIALSSFDKWNSPIGDIEINQDINRDLIENFGGKYFDEGYKKEHSVDVQIPFIQYILGGVKIIPVLIGKQHPQLIAEIIEKYYSDKRFGFVISSDLSHFLTDEEAQKMDNETAQMIETGNIQNFRYEQACGAVGIYGLIEFANKLNYSLLRINMVNSSMVTSDKTNVVGYGTWFLYEGSKNSFLKKYYSEYLLDTCRKVIFSELDKNKIIIDNDVVLEQYGASFVTLKKNGFLRGCIGSILAHQPLIKDLVQNSLHSAFKDPRFNPVEKSEMDDIKIQISLLSEPAIMNFKDEEDLLNQIIPNRDGIIIQDGNHQAVYLPSVWEDIPDKTLFLDSLKVKAGLTEDYFSETFQAYRFYTEYISQD